MIDRTELLESAMDSVQEGIALFALNGEIVFWNQAAEETTGYPCIELMGREVPAGLKSLVPDNMSQSEWRPALGVRFSSGALLTAHHKLGHEVQIRARTRPLRDVLGERIGTAVVFHPAETLDALPRGTWGDDPELAAGQSDLEERLRSEFEACNGSSLPFGVLWIKVDQAEKLHKTHGSGACAAMTEKIEHALSAGLRPAEVLGRWGDDEFLVISHERTPEMLNAHGRVLVGLARTAEFKWWGDRVSLTVSIGAAQACNEADETLAALLERAQRAMETSSCNGGNCVTSAQGAMRCSQS